VVDERPPLVAPALLLANLIWFFVGVVVAGRLGVPLWGYLWRGNTAVLERLGAVSAPDLLRGEWWRLGTCCFVHGMVWHAAVNLYSLGVAGSVAELLWGRWRALVIYAVSGLGGSCLAMALRPLDPATGAAVILVGASGAICGLLAAIIAWFLLFRRSLKRKVAADLAWRLWLVFAASVAVSFIPGVSWEGHLGGAAAGFAAAVLLYAIRFGGRAHRVLAAVLLVGLPVASVAGLQTAMKSGERWAPLRDRLAAGSHPDVLPLLEAIRPEAVHPVETEAARFLMLGPKRRTPERTAELRRKVEAVRLAAVDAEKRLALPTGIPAIDVDRPKWVAFAQARAESATLLVTMLNANEVPDEAAWKAWGDSRRHADRLWAEAVVHAAAVKPAAPPPPLPLPPRDRTRDPAPGLDQ
jgi:membrane associated rhomboid family serine protease